MRSRGGRSLLLVGAAFLLVLVIPTLARLYTEWLWFDSVGQLPVLRTRLTARWGFSAAGLALSLAWLGGNLAAAFRLTGSAFPDLDWHGVNLRDQIVTFGWVGAIAIAIVAGLAVGSQQGWVYIRHEYEPERLLLAREIERARSLGVLGDEVLGSGAAFDLRIFVSPGGYVLGEETALLEAMEGRRGEPRNRPPFPGVRGLSDKPTLINNVETYAAVPWIIRSGSAEFANLGTGDSKGTKVFALAGKVARGGLFP